MRSSSSCEGGLPRPRSHASKAVSLLEPHDHVGGRVRLEHVGHAPRTAGAVLGTDERATFVKRVQMVLKRGRCYDGAVSGRSIDAQEGIDRFVAAAAQKGNANIARIELAKATAADFDAWLREASEN